MKNIKDKSLVIGISTLLSLGIFARTDELVQAKLDMQNFTIQAVKDSYLQIDKRLMRIEDKLDKLTEVKKNES